MDQAKEHLQQLIKNFNIPFQIKEDSKFKLSSDVVIIKSSDSNIFKIYLNGRLICNNQKKNESYQLLNNGCIYYGQIENKKPNGNGSFKWSNGEQYYGQWLNAQKHGVGQWIGVKGDYYIGQWINGQQDGIGEHKWDGETYFGQWRNSVKNGYGIETFSNGDKYIGNYFYGKPQGNGEYRWQNGSIYQGAFLEGMRNGYGKWIQKNGQIYEGEYQNDLKHGIGKLIYQDGTIYCGNFQNDMKDGYGTIEWINGNKYEGNWKCNKFNGNGILITNDKIYKGTFINNQLASKEDYIQLGNLSLSPKSANTSRIPTQMKTIENHIKLKPQKFTLKLPSTGRNNIKNQSSESRSNSMAQQRQCSTKNQKSTSVDLKEFYIDEAQKTLKKFTGQIQNKKTKNKSKSTSKKCNNSTIFIY